MVAVLEFHQNQKEADLWKETLIFLYIYLSFFPEYYSSRNKEYFLNPKVEVHLLVHTVGEYTPLFILSKYWVFVLFFSRLLLHFTLTPSFLAARRPLEVEVMNVNGKYAPRAVTRALSTQEADLVSVEPYF